MVGILGARTLLSLLQESLSVPRLCHYLSLTLSLSYTHRHKWQKLQWMTLLLGISSCVVTIYGLSPHLFFTCLCLSVSVFLADKKIKPFLVFKSKTSFHCCRPEGFFSSSQAELLVSIKRLFNLSCEEK